MFRDTDLFIIAVEILSMTGYGVFNYAITSIVQRYGIGLRMLKPIDLGE